MLNDGRYIDRKKNITNSNRGPTMSRHIIALKRNKSSLTNNPPNPELSVTPAKPFIYKKVKGVELGVQRHALAKSSISR